MEQRTISPKEAKKRKLFLMLPIITLPFLTFLFYSLGGGKTNNNTAGNEVKKGFNFNLPIPKFKEDSALDKMSYYDQAAVDSIKLSEQIKKDPNYSSFRVSDEKTDELSADYFENRSFHKNRSALNSQPFQGRSEQKVYEKLRALEKVISQPPAVNNYGHNMREFENYGSSHGESEEVKKLEGLMSAMSTPPQADPELQQLGGMLENILDIQHPQRVQERLKQSSNSKKGKVYSVKKRSKRVISVHCSRMLIRSVF
ncbi:hypothetical protein [Flavobacterium sp. YO12]|uniref:hypothetical protein n=1 Tax=Flavobacterium sp. YO12 TaxID=1920029 RepID=UPI001F50C010|nr:hypothetical protein [Flavobacterium sp. YO12]